MPRAACAALAAALALGAAAAQRAVDSQGCSPDGRQQVALVNWFRAPACAARGTPGEQRTIVAAPLEVCHLVPGVGPAGNPLGGYRVSCAADGSGGGVVQFCSNASCASCAETVAFAGYQCAWGACAAGECARMGASLRPAPCHAPLSLLAPPAPRRGVCAGITGLPERFGSTSMSVDCFGAHETELPVNAHPANSDDFTATWYEAADCATGLCPANHFTVRGGRGGGVVGG